MILFHSFHLLRILSVYFYQSCSPLSHFLKTLIVSVFGSSWYWQLFIVFFFGNLSYIPGILFIGLLLVYKLGLYTWHFGYNLVRLWHLLKSSGECWFVCVLWDNKPSWVLSCVLSAVVVVRISMPLLCCLYLLCICII